MVRRKIKVWLRKMVKTAGATSLKLKKEYYGLG
jgi:hypothetical protein